MKTPIKISIAIVVFFLFLPIAFAKKKAAKKADSQEKFEEKMFRNIIAFPQVQVRMHYVDSASKKTRELRFRIAQYPSKRNKYYWVEAFEDNGASDYIHFNFRVDPKTREVRYLDTINDTLIDMKTWAKRGHK